MTAPPDRAEPMPLCDTKDLILIHKVLRYGFSEAEPLVRGVAEGDSTRAGIVADHVLTISSGLHLHHEGEDEILWDTLEQRSPGCAIHVSLMRSHHAEIATLIHQVEEAVPAWKATASATDRDRVAALVASIGVALDVHLGKEEELMLPVAAATMTQKEWDRLGEHVQASVPKKELLIQLGWIVEALGPDAGPHFLREVLPTPVRIVWSTVGKRQFAKHRRLVYGQ